MIRSPVAALTISVFSVVPLFTAGEGFALPPCQGSYDKTTWTNCVGSTILPEGATPVNTGDHYQGAWINGKPEGQGVLTGEKNGNFKHVGEFKSGGSHGIGTFTDAYGTYVGEWSNDATNGQDTFTFANGDEYIGEFKDQKFNGQGTYTYTYADGSFEEGVWKNNEFLYARKDPAESFNNAIGTYEGNVTFEGGSGAVTATIYPQGNTLVGTIKYPDYPESPGISLSFISMDTRNGELVFRWIDKAEGSTDSGLINMPFSQGFSSFVGTWGNLDSLDDGGAWSGSYRNKETDNFFLFSMEGPWDGEYRTQDALGSVATSDEICELLTHNLFSHPIQDYKVFGGAGSHALSWDGTAKGALWLKQKTEGLRYHFDEINLSHPTSELANKNLSDCLYRLDNSNPDVYQVLEQYFLVYLTAGDKCFETSYEFEQRVDDLGNVTERRISVERSRRKQCFNLDYGSARIGNWGWSTFAILLVWSEGHTILKTILDSGEQQVVIRVNELRQEETARAEESKHQKEEQVRLEREREERSSSERKESQRFEADNDNIRLALDVLNYTLTGDKFSRDGAIAARSRECTFYVFNMFGKQTLYVDNIIRDTVQFYSRPVYDELWEQWHERHDVECGGDQGVWNDNSVGTIFLHTDADVERVRKAWGLLFSQACEGASPREF